MRIIFTSLIIISSLHSTDLVEKMYNDRFYKYDIYFKKYSKAYDVPFLLLKAIAIAENAAMREKHIRLNANGTKDYGVMQINTVKAKEFNIEEKYLLHPEINIHVGAIILSNLIHKYGYNWNSIGKYHSKTMKFKKLWISRVKMHIKKIVTYDKRNRHKNALNRS